MCYITQKVAGRRLVLSGDYLALINSTMGDNVEDYQAKWRNTYTSFKRQFTIIDKLIGEAKACSVKLKDPEDRTEAKHARMLVDPIEHKLGLIKKYIDKLYELLPEAAPASEGGQWSVDALSATLEECMDRHTTGNKELRGFKDDIEEWELIHTKEAKPEGRMLAAGGGAPAGGAPRAPEIKGVATTLKPVELTSSIQAHEMTAWREQWEEFKDNSAFSKLGEKSVLAYLKHCVSREILIAVNYKEKNTEEELLEAIQEYLDTKVHPKIIRQLEIWRARQSDGSTVTESMRRQVCNFYDTNMEENTPEDWLKLLLYTTCQDKEILTKVLAKTRNLDTPQNIIDFVDAEECGKLNANRLLGGKNIVAKVGFGNGENTGRVPKCFICQAQGHWKQN